MVTFDQLLVAGQVFIRIDDKQSGVAPVQFDTYDPDIFRQWNEKGQGIYFSPSSFRYVSPEEHKANGTIMNRNDRYLEFINFVFADLDVTKEGDDTPPDEREARKNALTDALVAHLPPTAIIITKNGLQPLYKLSTSIPATDTESIERWKQVMNGFIEWSKQHGAKGDAVKDTARVLRVPGYDHHKGDDPYLCTLWSDTDTIRTYTLEELEAAFPYIPKEKERKQSSSTTTSYQGSDLLDQFAHIDIQEIATKAYESIGRSCKFDPQGRMILDGRRSGNFQGKHGDRQFLATTSGTEPVEGNKVTAVAQILGVNNTEAVKWLRETFHVPATRSNHSKQPVKQFDASNLPFRTYKEMMQEGKAYLDTVDPNDVLQYGYEPLDDHLAGIYKQEVVLIGGETGTGKSSFMNSILKHNASNGHKALVVTLEDTLRDLSLKDLYFKVGAERKMQGREKNYPWRPFRNNALESESYEQECAASLESIPEHNLLWYDKSHSEAPDRMDIDALEAMIEAAVQGGIDIVGIDHLHFFDSHVSSENKADRIEEIMQRIKRMAEVYDIAILLIAHYKKLNGEKPILDSFKDSISIVQTANVVINMWRCRDDDQLEKLKDEFEGREPRYETHFMIPKARSPVGEQTIIMQFNPETFDYEYIDQHEGTFHMPTAEEKLLNYSQTPLDL